MGVVTRRAQSNTFAFNVDSFRDVGVVLRV